MNHSKAFSGSPCWSFAEYGKLWTYHLNYFDFLNQPDMSREVGLELIRSFLTGMEGNRVGMEPFPISLRGINWIKFLTRWEILDDAVAAGLYRQYRRLLSNLEYHLLGNHLLENGFSLLFGACYFGDARFYRKAEEILRAELAEQILPDGGHFERSPMYHQIILGRVLDCINLLNHNGVRSCNLAFRSKNIQSAKLQDLTPLLEETAARMLGWLRRMTFSDGSIPLLNDAAYGIAPVSGELFACAERLGISPREAPLAESGYRKIVNDVYEAILDVGAIGPDYIPGHAHADTLSFELHAGGCPVIVDTGTSTYGDDGGTADNKAHAQSLRQRQRGTAAHNTVEIDGQDSSEVWGSFRVARRARVTELWESAESERSTTEKTTREEGAFTGGGYVPPVVIAAAHDGYRRLPGKPFHRREWRFSENGLRIRDTIDGDFREAVGRFHFHPEVRIEVHSDDCQTGTIHLNNKASVSWQIMKGRGRLAETTYCPEFNISLPNRCLEVRFDGPETVVEFVF